MRVIAGTAKGRRLRSVPGRSVRPTADRVKEALFSMLESRFDLGAGPLLDLFAGSGALGIEALSRGAPRVVFVEQAAPVRRVLEANLDACGFRPAAAVVARPAQRALEALSGTGSSFAGVLLDPPYGTGLAADSLARLGESDLLAADAWVAVEHHVDEALAPTYGRLRLTAARRYGKTGVAVYSKARQAEQVAES